MMTTSGVASYEAVDESGAAAADISDMGSQFLIFGKNGRKL
jgi:hypothetical protein